MKTSSDFIDDLRQHFGAVSDYALEPHTGWKRQQISRYRTRGNTFDDDTCLKVARWLKINPAFVMACMAAQRASSPAARSAWEIAVKKITACVLLTVGASGGMQPQVATSASLHNQNYRQQSEQDATDLYIMRKSRRRRPTIGRALMALQRGFARLVPLFTLA